MEDEAAAGGVAVFDAYLVSCCRVGTAGRAVGTYAGLLVLLGTATAEILGLIVLRGTTGRDDAGAAAGLLESMRCCHLAAMFPTFFFTFPPPRLATTCSPAAPADPACPEVAVCAACAFCLADHAGLATWVTRRGAAIFSRAGAAGTLSTRRTRM
jgi:hypothetical protein